MRNYIRLVSLVLLAACPIIILAWLGGKIDDQIAGRTFGLLTVVTTLLALYLYPKRPRRPE